MAWGPSVSEQLELVKIPDLPDLTAKLAQRRDDWPSYSQLLAHYVCPEIQVGDRRYPVAGMTGPLTPFPLSKALQVRQLGLAGEEAAVFQEQELPYHCLHMYVVNNTAKPFPSAQCNTV